MSTTTTTTSTATRTALRRAVAAVGVLVTAAAVAAAPVASASAAGVGTARTAFAAAASDGRQAGAGLATSADVTDFDAFLAHVVEDSATYWSGQLEAWGPRYGTPGWQPLQYAILDRGESDTSACTDGSGAPGVAGDPDEVRGASPAFFCSMDMTVYLSSPWLLEHVWSTIDGTHASDFGVAYVIAHEVGHAVQHDLGITEPDGATTVAPTELQADCLAGVWSNAKYWEDELEGDDIPEAVAAAASVGDFEFTDPGHHGTPAERSAAFMVGYGSGDAASCTLSLPGAV